MAKYGMAAKNPVLSSFRFDVSKSDSIINHTSLWKNLGISKIVELPFKKVGN